MKLPLAGLLALIALPAFAQNATTPLPVPPGQASGGIPTQSFTQQSPTAGFGDSTLAPAVTAAGTTQITATLLLARTNVVTTCAAGAGVLLPAVTRYAAIVVINRSGGSCIVYPTLGATVESAPGTAASVNTGVTIATNTDTIFRPISSTAWLQ